MSKGDYSANEDELLSQDWLQAHFEKLREEAASEEGDPRCRLARQLGGARGAAMMLQSKARIYRERLQMTERELHIVKELLAESIELARLRDPHCNCEEHIFDPRDDTCIICEKAKEEHEVIKTVS